MDIEKFEFKNELNLNKEELIEIYQDKKGEFEALNRLASVICNVPVSLINMLDDNFQYTVSKHGDWPYDSISPKQYTGCQYTILRDDVLVINDTLKDERVKNIKELVDDQSVRFYAGVPIKSPGGLNLGAICLLDFKPNKLSKKQLKSLKDLAKEVEYRLRLYRQKKKAEFANKKLSKAAAFLNNCTDILWTVDPTSLSILSSKGANTVFDLDDKELVGKNLLDIVKEVNFHKHLRNWIKNDKSLKKLRIPVKIELLPDVTKWLILTFSKYEENLLITGRDISAQHRAEQEVKKSLEEKEVLLSEIHHRVKNNLAMVNGMLMLERMNTSDKNISNVLLNSETRIITISKIHELLYETHDFSNVDLNIYINDLVSYLKNTFTVNEQKIKFETQISDIPLNVNQALPMGLIINELLTNSIKHAFKKAKTGTIKVMILDKGNDVVQFKVSDDGDGMDKPPEELKDQGSLGFSLISTLKQQLDADLKINTNNGTSFLFNFEKHNFKDAVSNKGVSI